MNTMMMDWRCRCGKRYGWAGGSTQAPPCPRCGAKPDPTELERVGRELEEAREALLADGPETASGRTEAVFLQDWLPGTFVYVGRKNPNFPGYDGLWGNPWSHLPSFRGPLQAASVEEAVANYRRWLEGDLAFAAVLPERRAAILRRLPELAGKRLACWRHAGPCHAQVLAELVERRARAAGGERGVPS